MQKTITLTKPSEAKPLEVKITTPNEMEITIEVKEKLELAEKVKIIEEISNEVVLSQFNYFNPLYLRTLAQVKTIDACTNINCDYTDLYGFYDILRENGVFKEILPYTEYQEILNWSYECAESLCKYRNSFMGFVQSMGAQSNGEEANETLKQLLEAAETVKNDPEVKQFLQEVAPHLG